MGLASQGGAGDQWRALRHTALLLCVPGIPTDASSANFALTPCSVGKACASQLSYILSPSTILLASPGQSAKEFLPVPFSL